MFLFLINVLRVSCLFLSLCVPAVLRWGCSSKLVIHPGVKGTFAAVSQHFWWPSMARDVCRFVTLCAVCAQTKSSNSPPTGLFRPLPIHIAMDFVTGLPASANITVILTVVDRFSKAFLNPASWSEQLPWVEYTHNSLPSSALGYLRFSRLSAISRFNIWWIGRVTVSRRGAGFRLGMSWNARLLRISFALASPLPRERQGRSTVMNQV